MVSGEHRSARQAAKTTPIRLIAFREIDVSRHHGNPIEGPVETPSDYNTHYRIEGFKMGYSCRRETPVSRTAFGEYLQAWSAHCGDNDTHE